eukprot:gene15529-21618_t
MVALASVAGNRLGARLHDSTARSILQGGGSDQALLEAIAEGNADSAAQLMPAAVPLPCLGRGQLYNPAAAQPILEIRHLLQCDSSTFCTSHDSGYYADPCDATCQDLLACDNGVTHSLSCAAGTVYNPTYRVCDWPVNYECPGAGEY